MYFDIYITHLVISNNIKNQSNTIVPTGAKYGKRLTF